MMLIDCKEATNRYIATLSDGFHCSTVGERLHIVTPYPYPDNDLIELFVEGASANRVRITDMGETARKLYGLGFELSASRRRLQLAETIAEGQGVMFERGQVMKEGDVSSIGELLFDVIVAARGISDLVLTSRTYAPATFKEEVGGLFERNGLVYEPSAKVQGRSGRIYTIDYRLPRAGVLLETLSPSQPGGMQNVVNRVFRVWSDVNGHRPTRGKVSLLNDVDFRWRDTDVSLLQQISVVRYWSREDELVETLRTPVA